MQGWSLEKKIQVTQTRIIEWYEKWEGKVYVSFSGGKDSTVLADLTARVCKVLGQELILWYSNTGMEYPEITKHVKSFPEYLEEKYKINANLIIDYPKDKNGKRITFKNIVLNEGYPVISKEVSRDVHDAKCIGEGCWGWKSLHGLNKDRNGNPSLYNKEKWCFLIDSPFPISNKCCNIMKKNPAHRFEKESGLKPIIGTMAIESRQRKMQWIKSGCNAFDAKYPSSKPLSFWDEQDILRYLKEFGVPYSSIYGEILADSNGKYYTTGLSRSGCFPCMYAVHLEKEPNRFQRMKETHPKLWEYCMKPCESGGLGMKEVLDFIGVKTE